jgi:prophage antirepressor-like protein
MTNLAFFEFRSNVVRTATINGEIAFCLSDVLVAIGSGTNASRAKSLIEEGFGEGVVIVHTLQTSGGEQDLLFVLESGLTFLLSRSRTELGKQLNRLIHAEILPSLRKTGKYQLNQPIAIAPQIVNPQIPQSYAAALLEAGRLAVENEQMTAQIQADAPATTLGKAIAAAPNNIRIGDFAKSIGMGQNRYFDELRDDGIIQQISTLPYQRFLDAKYFAVTQIIAGNGRTYPVALITPKGQVYLAKRHNQYISRETVRDAIECQVVALV